LDCSVGDAEALQGPHDERARGELVPQARMRLRARLGHDALAISIYDRTQRRDPISGLTALHQEFHASNVFDSVLILNPIPERLPSRSELSGRIRGIP
jgi:hypothetical protein